MINTNWSDMYIKQIDVLFEFYKYKGISYMNYSKLKKVLQGEEVIYTSPEETRVISKASAIKSLSENPKFVAELISRVERDANAQAFLNLELIKGLTEVINEADSDYGENNG